MKRALICLLICFGTLNLGWASGTDKEKLLESLAFAKEDTSRLALLFKLVKLTAPNPDENLKYIDFLLEAAQKQNNNRYICEAYLSYIIRAYNTFDRESIDKYLPLLEPLAQEAKLYFILFQAKRCATIMLQTKGMYELEEREALKMLKEAEHLNYNPGKAMAYYCLSNVYEATYRLKEAFDVLEKAYELSFPEKELFLCEEVSFSIILICEQMGDTTNWYKYLTLQQENLETTLRERPHLSDRSNFLMNYISFLKYYQKTKNWVEAEKMLGLMEQYYSEDYSDMHKYHYHNTRLYYFRTIQDWSRAMKEADAQITLTRNISAHEFHTAMLCKAEVLMAVGKSTEALALYKQTQRLKDSLNLAIIETQTQQLKSANQTDRQILSAEKNQQQSRIFLIAVIGTLLLLLLWFVIHTLRTERKLYAGEKEMRRMKNDMELANQAKERFLSNINILIRPALYTIVNNSFTLSSEQEIDPQVKQELSNVIRKTSEELMRLINDILTLSKLESGTMKYHITEVELIAILGTLAERHGIRIRSTLPHSALCMAHLDSDYFMQIFNSLLATPTKGGTKAGVELSQEGDSLLRITVRNSPLSKRAERQENMIRNEINRMLIERFEGQYIITTQSLDSHITILLPVEFTTFSIES